MAISPQPVVRSTSCMVVGWGFRGRRIKWRHFGFEQIQDGGRCHLGKISNGHNLRNGLFDPLLVAFISKISNGDISVAGSRVGFSGTANLTTSFKFTTGWLLLPGNEMWVIIGYIDVFGVKLSTNLRQILQWPTLVAMATKFETMWAITELV